MRSVILTAIAVCAITMTVGLTADVQAAEIGNTVWNDRNKNRVQDPGEEGIADVRIKLHNGDEVETEKTNSRGRYKFTDVEPGHYTIEVAQETLPEGCYPTHDRDGNKNGKYSDKYVSDKDTFTHADFGYYCPQKSSAHKVSPRTGAGMTIAVIALAIAAAIALAVYHMRGLKKLEK